MFLPGAPRMCDLLLPLLLLVMRRVLVAIPSTSLLHFSNFPILPPPLLPSPSPSPSPLWFSRFPLPFRSARASLLLPAPGGFSPGTLHPISIRPNALNLLRAIDSPALFFSFTDMELDQHGRNEKPTPHQPELLARAVSRRYGCSLSIPRNTHSVEHVRLTVQVPSLPATWDGTGETWHGRDRTRLDHGMVSIGRRSVLFHRCQQPISSALAAPFSRASLASAAENQGPGVPLPITLTDEMKRAGFLASHQQPAASAGTTCLVESAVPRWLVVAKSSHLRRATAQVE